jgi:hypothetical protein
MKPYQCSCEETRCCDGGDNRLRRFDRSFIALALAFLTGCSATSSLQSNQPNTELRIKSSAETSIPRTDSFAVTTFGNYEFEAKSQGHDPMYGVLPLKFNGGYLAIDILLFCPALFFNLREAFPYYQFDAGSGVVRYRKSETEEWTTYTPGPGEVARAKQYFAKAP